MAFDRTLHVRVLDALSRRDDTSDRWMFGGVCFLVGGHMACGILGDELIVRVGEDAFPEAMREPHTRLFDFTGRPMRGWVVVGPEALATKAGLARWVARGVAFAESLPPRQATRPLPPRRAD